MSMKNMVRIIFLVSVVAMMNSSCTEKIDLKLKSSTPQITVEGRISDQSGPYSVVITKSRLYTQDNSFTGLSSAFVVISDDEGNTDTLKEIRAGLYQTNSIQGVVGRTYKLSLTVEGTTYTSSCKMPPPVDIDSIVFSTEKDFKGNIKHKAEMLVRDPAGVANAYRIFSVMDGYYSVEHDRLWDGKKRNFEINHSDFGSGDTLQMELWSVDERIYNFFSEFNQNQNNFGTPAAPANPDPLFTPAALGFFSAHSIKSKTVIVP